MAVNTETLVPGSVDGMKRVGVFGGAFDPPHRAHVALANAALTQFDLDLLHVIPTGHAWHKSRSLTAAEHRVAMTRLAFEGLTRVVVDDRETRRAGPTYTIDTLEALQADYPAAQLHLFMGADQFAAFEQWHRWQDVADIATICIAARARIHWARGQFDSKKGLESRIRRLNLPDTPISATQVRALAAEGGDISALVPVSVARYIATHHLYRTA